MQSLPPSQSASAAIERELDPRITVAQLEERAFLVRTPQAQQFIAVQKITRRADPFEKYRAMLIELEKIYAEPLDEDERRLNAE